MTQIVHPKNSVGKYVPDAIRKTSRALGYALWIDQSDKWSGLPVVLAARLTERQRVGLAFASLRALPDNIAHDVALERLPDQGTGYPMPTIDSAMSDARWWAGLASPVELKSFAVAAFNHLTPADQAAFLAWASGLDRRAA